MNKTNGTKRRLLLFVLCASGFFAGTAGAHPPSEVDLKYAPQDGTLTIAALHNVQNPADHYIKEYVIRVDGKEVEKVELTSQTTPQESDLVTKLPNLAKGSVIEVTAECNKFGERKASLTVE